MKQFLRCAAVVVAVVVVSEAAASDDLRKHLSDLEQLLSSAEVVATQDDVDRYTQVLQPILDDPQRFTPLLDEEIESSDDPMVRYLAKLVKSHLEDHRNDFSIEDHLIRDRWNVLVEELALYGTAKGPPSPHRIYRRPEVGMALLHPRVRDNINGNPGLVEEMREIRNWRDEASLGAIASGNVSASDIQQQVDIKLKAIRESYVGPAKRVEPGSSGPRMTQDQDARLQAFNDVKRSLIDGGGDLNPAYKTQWEEAMLRSANWEDKTWYFWVARSFEEFTPEPFALVLMQVLDTQRMQSDGRSSGLLGETLSILAAHPSQRTAELLADALRKIEEHELLPVTTFGEHLIQPLFRDQWVALLERMKQDPERSDDAIILLSAIEVVEKEREDYRRRLNIE